MPLIAGVVGISTLLGLNWVIMLIISFFALIVSLLFIYYKPGFVFSLFLIMLAIVDINFNFLQGLFYNEYKNSLSFCREALQELHQKPVFLNTETFQFKKYYSLRERNYYKVLSKNYNYLSFFKKIWIKHRDYNKMHFLLRRLYMKIH